MVTWLHELTLDRDTGKSDLNGIAKSIGAIPPETWLRPAQRAALYRAAGMIDGIQLVDGAKDARGRTGTGIAWDRNGAGKPLVAWVFDAKTRQLLGTPEMSLVTPPTIVDRIGVSG